MAKNILLDVIIIISFVIYIKNENNVTEQIDKDKNKEQKNISLTEIKLENSISIIDDDLDINEIDYAEHIIIVNTHEDQLVESIFYFLSFVLIIYIILFLYKFYKCYCENTIKDFTDDNGMKNPQNDPELQRISTTDDENIIIDNNKNIKDDE